MTIVPRIVREPLLHFLLAGAAIFVVYQFLGSNQEIDQSRIVVPQAQIARIAAFWERMRSRPPTPAELRGLVEEHVKEEIYYREARALGLDSNDTVIRRRLRQKMEFLSVDGASAPEPSEAELAAYLERHRGKYRSGPKIAFRHVYLKPDRGGSSAANEAERLLRDLTEKGPGSDASGLGDPTQLPMELPLTSAGEIDRLFGQDFAAGVARLKPGKWAGPISSGYGTHLVLVRERVEARDPALHEIRDAVKRDLLAEREKETEQRRFERLRQRYTVTIEWPQTARKEHGAGP